MTTETQTHSGLLCSLNYMTSSLQCQERAFSLEVHRTAKSLYERNKQEQCRQLLFLKRAKETFIPTLRQVGVMYFLICGLIAFDIINFEQ